MMIKKTNTQFLLVAGVLEGRNFPSRQHHKIVVEAKFGGEILSTDEIEHDAEPQFHQELAWELDKKSLHEHRIQRSIIKVQVFAVDCRTSVRELIGYNVIDLHLAHSSKPNIKWYPLLHCRYPKSKPELKISICLEDQPDVPSVSGRGVTSSPANFKDLKPIWHTDSGDYYQLGPADKCTSPFCLSITVSSAAHLTSLIPPDDTTLLVPGRKFFFLYNLFGCNIATEHFSNLNEPNFLPERTSVRVRSSVDAIRQYFSKQPPFQVSLYCVDVPVPVGTCQLSLMEILPATLHELENRPVVVDRQYRLAPPKESTLRVPQPPNDLLPVVGLTISFKLESASGLPATGMSPSQRKSTPQMDEKSGRLSKSDNDHSHATATPPVTTPILAQRKQVNLAHFELAVELGSVSLAEGAQPLSNVTLCCSCGLFLTSDSQPTSLTTQPPIELITSGVPVPLAFSRFVVEFASRADRISSVLGKHEVKLQLWSNPKNAPSPILAAVGSLSLTRLAEAHSIVVLGKGGKTVEQQSITESVPLILAGELATGGQVAAHATASIVLRNLGAVEDKEDASQSPSKSRQAKGKSREKSSGRAGKGRLAHASRNGRGHRKPAVDSGKIQAALELELWKDAQEKLFEKQLKSREIEHMKEMAEEWHRRDQQRQQILTKKMEEYTRLDTELRSRLADVERREVELRVGEREIDHLRCELARYKEMRSSDLREAAKRMEEEAHHRIALEKMRVNQVEEELARLKINLQEAEDKNRRLEREFSAYKQQQRLTVNPESELLHKINALTLDKEELERRVESLQKAKLHYKQQWGHALRELSALRQEQTDASRQVVEKQQRDLEQMRLRYLADEEKKLLQNDFDELRRFREEVSRLGISSGKDTRSDSPGGSIAQRVVASNTEKKLDIPSSKVSFSTASAKPLESTSSSIITDADYVTRLMEERDTLLRTGVYSADDRIIVNLEKKISAALAARSEASRHVTDSLAF